MKFSEKLAKGVFTVIGAVVLSLCMGGSGATNVYASVTDAVAYTPSKLVLTQIAQTGTINVPKLIDTNNLVFVDGKQIKLSEPVKEDSKAGRTYLPARALSEVLGREVNWNAEYEVASVSDSDILIELPLKKNFAVLNSKEVVPIYENQPEVGSFEIKGRTYLPVRFIPEKLGYNVKYIKGGKGFEIHLTQKGKPEVTKPFYPIEETKPTKPAEPKKKYYDENGKLLPDGYVGMCFDEDGIPTYASNITENNQRSDGYNKDGSDGDMIDVETGEILDPVTGKGTGKFIKLEVK